MDKEKLLNELTDLEKAALVSGTDFMYTNPIPRLSIPSLRMSDGPHGLRVQSGTMDNGIAPSSPATAFPTAAALASSWNPNNAYEVGRAIAYEAKHYGVHVVLGPGTNIKRNPLCGRNFEYFSEDPFLSGCLSSSQIQGIQSVGVGVAMKHFALNNSENFRFMGESYCDQRAIREIYLKPFEIAIKEAHPTCIMSAYNGINGVYCSDNVWLNDEVLRKQWGFKGLVMTDWGGMHDRIASLKSGTDLEMPGDTPKCRADILKGLKEGTLDRKDLDKAVLNVLNLIEKLYREEEPLPLQSHHDLSGKIASDCAVLLKNDGILPLKENEEILIIGDLFRKMRYQGAGSSLISPIRLTTPEDAFRAHHAKYAFYQGYEEASLKEDIKLIDEAANALKRYSKALVFLGLSDYLETEGNDRETLSLPKNQLALMEALIKVGKPLIIILYGGSSMELPFINGVSAALDMYLPGENGGEATYSLLFGQENPSGHLAETWYRGYEDVPFGKEFGKTPQEIYKESIFVGYRSYAGKDMKVLYPFGHGLSYSRFEYLEPKIKTYPDKAIVSLKIKNLGPFDGADVIQLYVGNKTSRIIRPEYELKAFRKVYLKVEEEKQISLEVKYEDLKYFDMVRNKWVLEKGIYQFHIARDALDIVYTFEADIEGEEATPIYPQEISDIYSRRAYGLLSNGLYEKVLGMKIPPLPPKYPLRMDSRFSDFKDSSWLGRLLYWGVLSLSRKQRKKGLRLQKGKERDNLLKGAYFLEKILESSCPLSMSMAGGKRCPYNLAEAMVHFGNGRLFKGLRALFRKIKVPPLPKDTKAY